MPPKKHRGMSDIKGMLELDHMEVNNSTIDEVNNSTKKDTHVQKQIYISQEVIAMTEMYLVKQKLKTKQHLSFSAFVEQALKEKLEREQ